MSFLWMKLYDRVGRAAGTPKMDVVALSNQALFRGVVLGDRVLRARALHRQSHLRRRGGER